MKNLSLKEEGYLQGLFDGDGYVIYDKKSRHYQVDFYLNSEKDKDIIKFLLLLLKKKELNAQIYQDKRCHCKRIRIYSKIFFNEVSKGNEFKFNQKDFSLGYISSIIDSEGNINLKKSFISIVNTDIEIIKRCKKILSLFGIKSAIKLRKKSFKDRLNSYRLYISVKFKRLPHLSIKVGRFLQT